MTISIKPFNENYISVSFPDRFNDTILNAIRNVPNRKWNNSEKNWLIPSNQKSINMLLENIYETSLFNFDDATCTLPKEGSFVDYELNRLDSALKVRHYSICTIERYKKWVQNFLSENGKIESGCENKEINDYLKILR